MTSDEFSDNTVGGRVTRLEYGLKDTNDKLQAVGELLGRMDAKLDQVQIGRRPNWTAILTASGILFSILTGLGGMAFWSINANISASASPISLHVAQLNDAVGALHETQVKMWDKLGVDEAAAAASNADRQEGRARVAEQLQEIETQFRAQDQLNNLRYAESQRAFAMLYEQVNPGKSYPQIVYFPQMSQGNPVDIVPAGSR